MRQIEFVNNEYYHIYNRGVDKREVFLDKGDYARFLKGMREFNNDLKYEERDCLLRQARESKGLSPGYPGLSPLLSDLPRLAEIICYCLNSNHYHFILKQAVQGGISRFMHKLGGGYTTYFNQKYNRSGSLFQGPFKSIHINTNEYLLWLSVYVNTNCQIHNRAATAENYSWCSYPDYLGLRKGTLCQKNIILDQFSSAEDYRQFIKDSLPAIQEKKEFERYLME